MLFAVFPSLESVCALFMPLFLIPFKDLCNFSMVFRIRATFLMDPLFILPTNPPPPLDLPPPPPFLPISSMPKFSKRIPMSDETDEADETDDTDETDDPELL